MPSKWNERARAGFWVGIPEEFFWLRKRGVAEWWDGHCFRVVINNFYVYEQRLLDLVAPNNQYLPAFPSDSDPAPASPSPPPSCVPNPSVPTAGDVAATKDLPADAPQPIVDLPSAPIAARQYPTRDRKQVQLYDPAEQQQSKSSTEPKSGPARQYVQKLMPQGVHPAYKCEEYGGKGWLVDVIAINRRSNAANVRYVNVRSADGS